VKKTVSKSFPYGLLSVFDRSLTGAIITTVLTSKEQIISNEDGVQQ